MVKYVPQVVASTGPSAERQTRPFPPVGRHLRSMLPHMPRIRAKKASYPRSNFLKGAYILWCRAPSAKHHPLRRSKCSPPHLRDRFHASHTCPAYEQKKKAIPGRIYTLGLVLVSLHAASTIDSATQHQPAQRDVRGNPLTQSQAGRVIHITVARIAAPRGSFPRL